MRYEQCLADKKNLKVQRGKTIATEETCQSKGERIERK